MVKLVDTYASEAYGRKAMGVQVSLPAPFENKKIAVKIMLLERRVCLVGALAEAGMV